MCNPCHAVMSHKLSMGVGDMSIPTPKMELKLIHPHIRSNHGNAQRPQHARFWQLLVDIFQAWLSSSSPPKVCNDLWFVAANMGDVSQCSWSIYNVVVHNDGLHWGRLMHTIHVRWQHQCTICLRHFYVLHQFGVFKYKLITRRNNITYSFNMRWMFIIVHGHISQHALQLHFSQRKKKKFNTCYICCTILEV